MFSIVKKDVLYKNVLDKYCHLDNKTILEKLSLSGYIFEKRTNIDNVIINDLNFPSLNISNIDTKKENPAIIVTTGSFSPIHDGHIDSLKIAKDYVESIGYNVIKGVISLSHDNYVSYKRNGESKLDCSIRTDLVYRKLHERNEKWISVDKLEGEMVSTPINFSTVICRIKKYIEHNLNIKNITVFYVFGSDNIFFYDAFSNNDIYHAICINRNNDNLFDYHQKEKNFHYLDNNQNTKYLSSTIIRNNSNKKVINKDKIKKVFMIRGDGCKHNFNKKLINVFRKYFDDNIDIRLFYTNDYKYNKNITISIDKHIKGKYNLDVSRQFNICDSNISPNKLIINNIPLIDKNKSYTLLDDDTVSGYTIKNISKILKEKSIKITKYDFVLSKYIKTDEVLFDVVDAIDFMLYSENGGLVLKVNNNKNIRFPYIFPFINLTYRSSIKPQDQISFSLDILNINDNNIIHNDFYHYLYKNKDIKNYLTDIYKNYLESK